MCAVVRGMNKVEPSVALLSLVMFETSALKDCIVLVWM